MNPPNNKDYTTSFNYAMQKYKRIAEEDNGMGFDLALVDWKSKMTNLFQKQK